jgi:hypothetical protein
MDYEGRIVGAYADGCVGCTSPGTSRSDLATIVRQSGRQAPARPVRPRRSGRPARPARQQRRANGDMVSLNWSAPDNGGSSINGYNIYRKEGAAGVEGRIGTTTKTIFDDATGDPTKQYFYRVTAVNAHGESGSCGSFPVGDAPVTQSPCTTPA